MTITAKEILEDKFLLDDFRRSFRRELDKLEPLFDSVGVTARSLPFDVILRILQESETSRQRMILCEYTDFVRSTFGKDVFEK